MGTTDIATVAILAHMKGERRMRIVVKRTTGLVAMDREPEPLSDPLDGEVDETLKLIFLNHNNSMKRLHRFISIKGLLTAASDRHFCEA